MKTSRVKCVVFDLDNTLYDSSQYISGAFNVVADHVARKNSIQQRKVYSALVKVWKKKTSIYPSIFEDALKPFGLSCNIRNLVKLFNDYSGAIAPYPDAIPTLTELKANRIKLALVTDGNVPRQKRKIRLLAIGEFLDAVVFTDEMAAKPSPFPFIEVLKRVHKRSVNSIYVGDNPVLDFRGPKIIGMGTARLLRGEFCRFPRYDDIDVEIKGLGELLKLAGCFRRSKEKLR
jgi:putative hydrolase of the HAD superfamily